MSDPANVVAAIAEADLVVLLQGLEASDQLYVGFTESPPVSHHDPAWSHVIVNDQLHVFRAVLARRMTSSKVNVMNDHPTKPPDVCERKARNESPADKPHSKSRISRGVLQRIAGSGVLSSGDSTS